MVAILFGEKRYFMQSNGGVFNVEKIKVSLNRNICIIVAIVISIVLCVGIGCYFAGRQSAERDVDVRRIQSTQQQLNNATKQLDEAAKENRSAREITADSVVINDRIEQRIDSSETAVSRSEEANTRASAAVKEAQRIITVAKSTATESERIASDSKSILERAITRNQRTAIEAEKK